MNIWFTADDHFNHSNIISYCNRPFKTLEEMNNTLIKNWNSRVKPDDTIFVIGDLLFRNSPGGKRGEGTTQKTIDFIKQLNGNIIVIKGNHDKNNTTKTCIEKIIIRLGGEQICLVHNPFHADSNYEFNFVGHVHEKWKFKLLKKGNDFTYLINVGVDVWNFRPVKINEIMRDFKRWERSQRKIWSPEEKDEKNSSMKK